MFSVLALLLSGTWYLIFKNETIEEGNLEEGMKLRIRILGISRKNEYIEKNITYKRDLQYYTAKSLRMTIIKKFAEALGLENGDIVNLDIISKE